MNKKLFSAIGVIFILATLTTFLSSCNPITGNDVLQGSDTIAPVIAISAPADGSSYSAVVTVEGYITDAADSAGSPGRVDSITCDLAEAVVPDSVIVGTDGSFSADISTVGMTGTITIKITATDWNSNTTTETLKLTAPKEITYFAFLAADNSPELTSDWEGTIDGTDISVPVPDDIDITDLVAAFETNAASVKVGGVTQNSHMTPNDFSSPVYYNAVANDGSSQAYVVTVLNARTTDTIAPVITLDEPEDGDPYNSMSTHASGTIVDYVDAAENPGEVSEASWELSGTSHYGTFSLNTGGEFDVNLPTNDVEGPITFKVTAVDWNGNESSLSIGLEAPKEITSFSFLDVYNTALSEDVTAAIDGTIITASVPDGTDVSGLVASFEWTGVTVKVGSTNQVSGLTPNDFRNLPVEYVVTDNHEDTKTYTVTVSAVPAAPAGLSLTVLSASEIDVSWTDASNNEDGFKLQRKAGSGGTYEDVTDTAGTSFSDTGLQAAVTYYYRVCSYNTWGDSVWEEDSAMTERYIHEVVDADAYSYVDIVIDSSDRPHVVYVDNDTTDSLKYAYWDGSDWQIETVETGTSVWYASIAMGGDDIPRVTYGLSSGSSALRYAYRDGTGWHPETVEAVSAEYMCIDVDSSNHPHICYFADASVKYAHDDGTGWSLSTVDDGDDLEGYCSLALDSSDVPHICFFYDSFLVMIGSRDLMYTYWNGTGWETPDDLFTHGGSYSSIAIDSNDDLHFSLVREEPNHNYEYPSYHGPSYSWAPIAGYDDIGRGSTALALDSYRRGHVVFQDTVNEQVRYWTEFGTNLTTIASVTFPDYEGYNVSIAVDSEDRPHIVYACSEGLKYYFDGLSLYD